MPDSISSRAGSCWLVAMGLEGGAHVGFSHRVPSWKVMGLRMQGLEKSQSVLCLDRGDAHARRRLSRLVNLRAKEHLRVAGSAFLVTGRLCCLGFHERGAGGAGASFQGPRILPPMPSLYLCATDIKARILETPFALHSDPEPFMPLP